ncbi:ribonuclease H-like domain-containing protein [Tanacetum coccineum]
MSVHHIEFTEYAILFGRTNALVRLYQSIRCLSRRFDTSYPTGGCGVSGGLPEHNRRIRRIGNYTYVFSCEVQALIRRIFFAGYGHLIDSLHREFDMTDLGALNYFLGISVVRHSAGLFLSQRKYALQILEHANMVNCNPSRTPVDTESKLGPDGVPVQDPTFSANLPLYARSARAKFSCPRAYLAICSGAEAEYQGVANVVVESTWICNLLCELHSLLSTATLVYCDNVSAVYMSANLVQHQRTKHIEIDIHFVRDMVTTGQVRVLHVPSPFQYVEIFIKGLPSALFEEFRSSLSIRPPPAPSVGAY